MLPAGRPSLGLGSSESAVSTEPKNASASMRRTENWRGRRHSARAWSEETNGVYLGVFGSDQIVWQCHVYSFQF